MAVRTIKLRIVLDNSQALRSAQRFGDKLREAGRKGKTAGKGVMNSWAGLKSMFTGLAGFMGIGMVVRMFRQVIQNIYDTDVALATLMRNQDRRQRTAASSILSDAGQKKLGNVWGDTTEQQRVDWAHRVARQYRVVGGYKAVTRGAYPLASALGDMGKTRQEQMDMIGDVMLASTAFKSEPAALSEFAAQAFQNYKVRDRAGLQEALSAVGAAASGTPYTVEQITSAARRGLPPLVNTGSSVTEGIALVAAFSPFFANQPRFAGRFIDMMTIQNLRKQTPGMRRIAAEADIDPSDRTRGFAGRNMLKLSKYLGSLPHEEAMRAIEEIGMEGPRRIQQGHLKELGGMSEMHGRARGTIRRRNWESTLKKGQQYRDDPVTDIYNADLARAHGKMAIGLAGTPHGATNLIGRLQGQMQGSGWEGYVAEQALVTSKTQRWAKAIKDETLQELLQYKGIGKGLYASLQEIVTQIGTRIGYTGNTDLGGGAFQAIRDWRNSGANSSRVSMETKIARSRLASLANEAGSHMQTLARADQIASSKQVFTIQKSAEQAVATYKAAVTAAALFLERLRLDKGAEMQDPEAWTKTQENIRTPQKFADLPWVAEAATTRFYHPVTGRQLEVRRGSGVAPSSLPQPEGRGHPTSSGSEQNTGAGSPGGVTGASASPVRNTNIAVAYMATPSDSALTTFGRIT